MSIIGWGFCFENIAGASKGLSGTTTPDLAPSIPACLLLGASKGQETLVTLDRWGAADPSKLQV